MLPNPLNEPFYVQRMREKLHETRNQVRMLERQLAAARRDLVAVQRRQAKRAAHERCTGNPVAGG
jgi:hypothetical protein